MIVLGAKMYIIDNGSTYIESLVELLVSDNPIVVSYDQLDEVIFRKGDCIILAGGHGAPVLWHGETYAREIALIKHHDGPIIGICLGFELIAHVYGSHLHHLNARRKGIVTLTTAKNTGLQLPPAIEVFESHNWSVEHVKRPLRALAYSSDGVEIFRHSRRPMYGLQFHPENSSEAGKALFLEVLASLRH